MCHQTILKRNVKCPALTSLLRSV